MSEQPPKLCPHIILEGTRLTHKTALAFALNEHPRITGPRKYRYHSPLISAEWCSFTNYPWGHNCINFQPEEEAAAMEVYRLWARMFELQKYYSWIIDRFHISTIATQKLRGREIDFNWLEERLQPLQFCIVFCKRPPETFETARDERLKTSGNPKQYENLDLFIREQNAIEEIISASRLPALTLDVSSENIPALADAVADWLQEKKLLGFYDTP